VSRGPRSRRWLLRLLLGLFLLLVVEVVVVATVLVSPGARDAVSANVGRALEAWEGDEELASLPARASARLRDAYEGWIEPLYAVPAVSEATDTFGGCVSCHEDIATERRFGDLYMDHPVHAELGVRCATCHVDVAHPSPPAPEEGVCADCHAEDVQTGGDCTLCHAPGALPHFLLLGAPRDGVVACETCHTPGSLEGATAREHVAVGPFDGSSQEECASCHKPATCDSCHEPGHPADWSTAHAPAVDETGTQACIDCHTGSWCADSCHAVTPTTPLRPRPLPEGAP
jgi:hypothetical protein